MRIAHQQRVRVTRAGKTKRAGDGHDGLRADVWSDYGEVIDTRCPSPWATERRDVARKLVRAWSNDDGRTFRVTWALRERSQWKVHRRRVVASRGMQSNAEHARGEAGLLHRKTAWAAAQQPSAQSVRSSRGFQVSYLV